MESQPHLLDRNKFRDKVMESQEISLREYIEGKLNELDKRVALVFQNHSSIHDSEYRALQKAAGDITSRLEGMNEFRAQISLERQLYVSRVLFDSERNALETKLEALINSNGHRITVLERAQSGAQGSMWMLGVVATILGVVVGLIFRYLHL